MTNFYKVSLLAMIMIFLVKSGYCQQTELKKEQRMEELIESLEVTDEATSEGSLLLEDLSYYATHPILINKATEEELSRLNLLNFRQIRSILNYREKYGQILTIKELSVLGEFSDELLQKIEPFFLFAQERDSLDLSREKVVRQSFLARIKGSLPTPVGYSSSNGKPAAYGGTPFGYFSRYRCEVGKWLDIGITTENDAGEEFFRKSNKFGFDFLSGFVCWNGEGVVRKVVAGDYHLRFGQGVSLWSGGGVSYVSDLSSMMRTGEGIRPYSSTDENRFFRGAAVQFDFKPVKLSLFFSSREKDANLTSDSIAGDSITSFRMDGLHRTISELSDEKNVNERMIGGYGDFRFNRWRFGLLVSYLKFGLPVSNGDSPYKSKTFEGDVNLNFGLDYHLILNEINFFGEAGLSQNGKPAFVNGVVWKAHPQLSLSMLYRYYDPAFQSFNSGAFAEGSGGRNEKGIFVAFEYCPVSKVKIGAQADLFYFPWLTFQTITPAQGRIYTFRFEVAIRKNLSAYVQTRYTNKPQKTSGTTGVPEQWEEITSKWRAHLDWKVSERLQFRSRVEKVGYQYNSNSENGYLLFQDAIFTASDKLKCWLRVAYYNTDGYNSRVYSYENDLLYYFAIPEFHGIGMRSYLNLKWQPSKNLVVYGKAGYTFREGETSMGSGNDASPGNRKFDFRSQICLKF